MIFIIDFYNPQVAKGPKMAQCQGRNQGDLKSSECAEGICLSQMNQEDIKG